MLEQSSDEAFYYRFIFSYGGWMTWLDGICFSCMVKIIPLQLVLVASAVKCLWHKGWSRTWFVWKCLCLRLLYLMTTLFCPVLNVVEKLDSLISKCLKVFFLYSLHFQHRIVADGCTCCLLLLHEEWCEHGCHLWELVHDLQVDRRAHYSCGGTGDLLRLLHGVCWSHADLHAVCVSGGSWYVVCCSSWITGS